RIRTYTVKIKPGVRDGTRIRLKGKGEAGTAGGPAGDLIVVTRVDRSPIYERRGDDLVVSVPVSFPTAALDGSGRGDVLARVRIQVPKRLGKRERELLEELQKVSG